MQKKFFPVIVAATAIIVILLFLVLSQTPGGENLDKNKTTGNTKILLETSEGNITIQLFDNQVPITAANFKKLVQQGFYNGTIFHRIIKDFMIQGGDPTGTGTGGPEYTIKDEFVSSLKHSKAGILSMANTGQANTGGSQFFITLVPTPWLDGKHSVFGEVIEGMNIVEKIGATQTDSNDKPIKEIKIIKATVI